MASLCTSFIYIRASVFDSHWITVRPTRRCSWQIRSSFWLRSYPNSLARLHRIDVSRQCTAAGLAFYRKGYTPAMPDGQVSSSMGVSTKSAYLKIKTSRWSVINPRDKIKFLFSNWTSSYLSWTWQLWLWHRDTMAIISRAWSHSRQANIEFSSS